jgi:hypothetical protein
MKHTPPTFKDFILATAAAFVFIVILAAICEVV